MNLGDLYIENKTGVQWKLVGFGVHSCDLENEDTLYTITRDELKDDFTYIKNPMREISKLNIAIEYDENNHRYYDIEQENLREERIKKELGCDFIRVSDNKTHIENSAIVLNCMFKKKYNIK